MRKMLFGLAATAAAAMTFAVAPAAEARQGCGNGWHRAPSGRCVPNRGGWNRHNRGPVLVVGRWYDGRGYWDGRRYWQNRYRHNNGWRYR